MNQIQDIFTIFFKHLRRPSLNENVFLLTYFSFSGYCLFLIHPLAKWRRDIWPWERGWFNLTSQPKINLCSTSILGQFFFLLKCGLIAFQKTKKTYSIIFSFCDIILCNLNQKIKQYIQIKIMHSPYDK